MVVTFDISFQNEEEFDVSLSENIVIVDPGEYPVYHGETDIVPKAHSDIVLETNGKLLLSDVNIHKIPYYETTNVSGITVYIGGDD